MGAINQRIPIPPKSFKLVRTEDASGVSGTGEVAFGVMWEDRSATVHFCSEVKATTTYFDLDDVVRVHGHEGKTKLVWL